jgi:hypothetical protein
MDLKLYYQKIRETQAGIGAPYTVVVSHETPDGGKAGLKTEVSAPIAAKMVVEGTAHLASPAEVKEYREALVTAKEEADELEKASRVQVTLVPTADLNKLRNALKTKDRA